MNKDKLIVELQNEYKTYMRLSNSYFDSFIDKGLSEFKEKELLYLGASYAILRVFEIIESYDCG